MARMIVVLPQPDSPTRPTISPGRIARLMRSSTGAVPFPVRKESENSPISRSAVIISGAAPRPGIEDVTQPVSDKVEAEHGQKDREAGRQRIPPCLRQMFAAFGDHAA